VAGKEKSQPNVTVVCRINTALKIEEGQQYAKDTEGE